jgi:outer membrane immunogenic protein
MKMPAFRHLVGHAAAPLQANLSAAGIGQNSERSGRLGSRASGASAAGAGGIFWEVSMRMRFGAALVGAAMASTAAMAADIGPGSRSGIGVARLGGYSWTGPYVGANLGYQWGSTTNSPTKPGGVAGGIQAGYNWQTGSFVFGAETDLQISGADDVFAPYKFSNPWFGTLRGRAGVALNNVLFYGTVGLAYGGIKVQSTTSGVDESKTHAGWAAGAGMEVALAGNWTAKAEYLYVDLSSRGYSLTGTSHGIDSSHLRLGVNYRF